jgi:hypothetical protein
LNARTGVGSVWREVDARQGRREVRRRTRTEATDASDAFDVADARERDGDDRVKAMAFTWFSLPLARSAVSINL